jgi:hypothetical protein
MLVPSNIENVPIEKSDLRKLKNEVLDHGPEATLPKNLSDAWLSRLERDLEMLQYEQKEDHGFLSAPLAVIVNILFGKHGNSASRLSFSEGELIKYLNHLRLEISLEVVRRHMGTGPEPATLDTIFTNRILHDENLKDV